MSTASESTAELLRARNIAGELEPIHVACLFAVEKGKGAKIELPSPPALQLQMYGLVELGKPFVSLGRPARAATLTSLGETMMDVLLLEGRHVKGVGIVKRVGDELRASDGRGIATMHAARGVWRCEPGLGGAEREQVILMFCDLTWS